MQFMSGTLFAQTGSTAHAIHAWRPLWVCALPRHTTRASISEVHVFNYMAFFLHHGPLGILLVFNVGPSQRRGDANEQDRTSDQATVVCPVTRLLVRRVIVAIAVPISVPM